ncbi:uncharacterized protein FFMR_10017 [Fusarium fujikuroi]|nr:uncharacterized protein FFMR_10017 [Fusarium fujikuroi]
MPCYYLSTITLF